MYRQSDLTVKRGQSNECVDSKRRAHALETSQTGVTATSDQMVTSLSSKSELALNRSVDGKTLTFMGYYAPVINSEKSQASGDRVPRRMLLLSFDSFRLFRSLSDSALSSEACLRLQLLHAPIPLIGCRNHYSAKQEVYRAPRGSQQTLSSTHG